MVTPNISPDSGRPSEIEEDKNPSNAGPITNPDATGTQPTNGELPTITQADLATSDGAGIRGDYGDADQTTGLEGGENQPADAGPDRADQNPTNAAQPSGA